ncbi:MAG: hypothetical protein IIZ06_02745 [Kiritimatiellae bacterium]|nr:hypothetical protein [Kiritimatiellia bacterium]
MSIANIRPSDCPVELRVKIEKVARRKKMTWRDAVIFLARGVVSPRKR